MKTKKNNAVNEVATATVAVAEPTPTAQIRALATPAQVVSLSTDLIEPSNLNARKTFDPEALRELAQNIATHGVIQPITVRASSKGHYEIICGERRFRASRLLNMPEIPAIVQVATDEQAYDLSISENLQREDVPLIEAAEAYKRLIDTGRYDVKSLALQFGRSEKSIYQVIKLCDLIGGIADLCAHGQAVGIVRGGGQQVRQEDTKGHSCRPFRQRRTRRLVQPYRHSVRRQDKTMLHERPCRVRFRQNRVRNMRPQFPKLRPLCGMRERLRTMHQRQMSASQANRLRGGASQSGGNGKSESNVHPQPLRKHRPHHRSRDERGTRI